MTEWSIPESDMKKGRFFHFENRTSSSILSNSYSTIFQFWSFPILAFSVLVFSVLPFAGVPSAGL